MAKTADSLLTGLKRRITIPAAQPLLENGDFLAMADEEIRDFIVPKIVAAREDFFVTSSTESCVASQANYYMPERVLARGLRDLKMYDSDDREGTIRSLQEIAIEEEHLYSSDGEPLYYYYKGDQIIIKGTPDDTTWTIEWWWEEPPSSLVLLEDVGIVASKTSTIVTCTAAVDTDVFSAGVIVDFIRGKSGHSTLAIDKTVTTVSGTDLTFATGLIPSALVAGDYVSIRKTSPVIQLPDQAGSLVELRTCKRILEAISDFEAADRMAKDIDKAEESLLAVIRPRNRGETTKIVDHNSLLRGRRGRFKIPGLYRG